MESDIEDHMHFWSNKCKGIFPWG